MSTVMPPEIASLMGSTITVKYQDSIDLFGKRTYAGRGDFKCYPVHESVRIYSLEGREDTSTLTVYVNTDTIDANDIIVFRGTEYKILSVETWVDQTDSVWGQVVHLQ